MIRWDPAGEYIIVEKPEQLALHVLPSVYRQSRFASFSRQLNVRPALSLVPFSSAISLLPLLLASPLLTRVFHTLQIYGFMRKVNLRNVDPAIDDPDASTWCEYCDVSIASSIF